MNAVVFHEHGGPEVLRYEAVPDPVTNASQVLVRVRACGLNHLDLWERRGLEHVKIPLPHISGSDIAGDVAAVGELVTRVKPGDRVMIQPGLSCGRCEACLGGEDNLCRQYDVLGYRSPGGYAELVAVPEANVIPIPDHIDFERAAAFPLVFLTAWRMLVTKAGVRPGDEVLVLAAGSGVGQAAVQIAKLHGARVIATAGSNRKLARAREIGADETINHSSQDLAQEVKRLTGRRGVDIVIEHVGTATFEKSLLSLAPKGRLVTCGATTGPQATFDIRYLFNRQLCVIGSYMGSKGELLRAARFFFSGQIGPVIDRVLPLDRAEEAQRALESREQFGKIVLKPAP